MVRHAWHWGSMYHNDTFPAPFQVPMGSVSSSNGQTPPLFVFLLDTSMQSILKDIGPQDVSNLSYGNVVVLSRSVLRDSTSPIMQIDPKKRTYSSKKLRHLLPHYKFPSCHF